MEQPKYNLLSREIVEKEYAELYPRIGLTVFSPLAGGILTGKYSGNVIPEGSRQVCSFCTKAAYRPQHKTLFLLSLFYLLPESSRILTRGAIYACRHWTDTVPRMRPRRRDCSRKPHRPIGCFQLPKRSAAAWRTSHSHGSSPIQMFRRQSLAHPL